MSRAELIWMSPMDWETLWAQDGDRGSRTATLGPGADQLFALYGVEAENERAAPRALVGMPR